MAYLLDTNILSDLIRNGIESRVAGRILAVGEDAIKISIITAMELRFGAAKKGSEKLTDRVDRILARFEVLPLGLDSIEHYAAIRVGLQKQPIGNHDMLIAAQAMALDLTLVTANAGEFERVRGLKIENWLE